MANNNSIKGITIEIGASTEKLTKALSDVSKNSTDLQKELRQVDNALKFDPGNAELLGQKFQVLSERANETSRRLALLKNAQKQVDEQFAKGKINEAQYRAFNREIVQTENVLKSLKGQIKGVQDEQTNIAKTTEKLEKIFKDTGKTIDDFSDILGDKLVDAIKDGRASAKQLEKALDRLEDKKINVDVKADTSEVNKLETAIEGLSNGARRASSIASSAIRGIGTAATGAAAGISAITVAMQDTNKDLAMFETQLQQVGLSTDDVTDATVKFMAVGQHTDQITEAMGNLVQAGYTTAEQIDNIAASISGAIAKYGDTFNAEGIAESITSTVMLGEASGQLMDLLEKEGVNIDTFNARLQTMGNETERANYISQLLAQQGLAQLYAAYATGNEEIIRQAEAQYRLTQNMAALTTALTPVLTAFTEFAVALSNIILGEQSAEQALEGFKGKLLELFPVLDEGGSNALDNFVQGMRNVLPEVMQFMGEVLSALWEGCAEILPEILDLGMEILQAVIDGIGERAPELIDLASQLMSDLLNAFFDALPDILDSGGQMMESLKQGIDENKELIIDSMLLLLKEIVLTIIDYLPEMLAMGKEITEEIKDGLLQAAKDSFNDAIDSVIAYIKNPFANEEEKGTWLGIGKDIISGFVKGITDEIGRVKKSAEALASKLPEWIKKPLGIHSPSRVMMQIGEWTGEGLSIGLDGSQSMVSKSMKDLGEILVKIANQYTKDVKAVEQKLSKDIANLKKKDASTIKKLQQQAQQDQLKLKEQYNKTYLDNVQSFIDNKKSLEQLSLVEEAKIWEQSIQLFEEGTDERIKAQEKYKDAVETIQKEILDINKQYQSQMQAINDELVKNEQELTKAYEDELSKRYNTHMNSTGLFDEFNIEVKQSGQELLYNLQSQVTGLEQWQQQMQELMARGIGGDLLTELQEMGTKALPQLIALNQLTDEQLTEYANLYAEKSRQAREQAEKELEGTRQGVEFAIGLMREQADTSLTQLEEEWILSIQKITEATSTEFNSLEQVGADAGASLLEGLSSMEGALLERATQIAANVNGAISNVLEISPTASTQQEPKLSTGGYNKASKVASASGSDITKTFNDMKQSTYKTFEEVGEQLTLTMETYTVMLTESWTTISLMTSTSFNNILKSVIKIFTDMRLGISKILNQIIMDIRSTSLSIITYLQTLDLYSVGVGMIQQLIDGIRSMQSTLIQSMVETVRAAVEAAKAELGINSPSKVFMEMAEDTNEGYIVGLERSAEDLNKAISNVYGNMVANAQSVQNSNTYNNSNSYDYSKSMSNQITINSQQDSGKAIERALRRLAFSF